MYLLINGSSTVSRYYFKHYLEVLLLTQLLQLVSSSRKEGKALLRLLMQPGCRASLMIAKDQLRWRYMSWLFKLLISQAVSLFERKVCTKQLSHFERSLIHVDAPRYAWGFTIAGSCCAAAVVLVIIWKYVYIFVDRRHQRSEVEEGGSPVMAV